MNRGPLVAALGMAILAGACGLSTAATLPVDSQDAATLQPLIDKFLQTQIATVGGNDFVAAAEARQAIIAEVTVTIPTAPQPSATFTNLYGDALIGDLGPLLKSSDARIRLNAAIIVARISERSNGLRFIPTVVQLLSDPSLAVAQWGVHAAQFILPQLLNNPTQASQSALVPALVKVVGKHADNSSIVEAAYHALAISDKGPNSVTPAQWPSAVTIVVDAMQSIMQKRLDLYQKNMAPMPTIEGIAVAYLVSDRIWNAGGPKAVAQQHKTIELMCRLASDAAQRGSAAGSNDRADLVYLLRGCASGFQVAGEYVKNPALVNAGKTLATVNNGAAANFVPLTDAVIAAVGQIPVFNDVKPAATLPTSMPTSGPSTAP